MPTSACSSNSATGLRAVPSAHIAGDWPASRDDAPPTAPSLPPENGGYALCTAMIATESHPARPAPAPDRRAPVETDERRPDYRRLGRVVWLTGPSTVANAALAAAFASALHQHGRLAAVLDESVLRGIAGADRIDVLPHAARVATFYTDAGFVCIAALPALRRSERQQVRALFASGKFLEVHVAAPATSPVPAFEVPLNPEFTFDPAHQPASACVAQLTAALRQPVPLDAAHA